MATTTAMRRKAHFSYHTCNEPTTFCHQRMDARLIVRDPKLVTCALCVRETKKRELYYLERPWEGRGPWWWIEDQLRFWDVHCRALGAPDPRTPEYREWRRGEKLRAVADSLRYITGGPIGKRIRRNVRSLLVSVDRADQTLLSRHVAKLRGLYRAVDALAARFATVADGVERVARRRSARRAQGRAHVSTRITSSP